MATLLPLSIAQPFVFFGGNDTTVLWSLIFGSTWNSSNTPIVDGIGSLTITDAGGNPVAGATDVPFSATPTPGTYTATIAGSGFNPANGSQYQTQIGFSSVAANASALWKVP